MTTDILNEIIEAAENDMSQPVRVTDARELIALSFRQSPDVETPVIQDREKEFYLDLYIDAFENVSFILKQWAYILNSHDFICPWTDMADYERRLSRYIKGLEITKDEVLPYVFLYLRSMESPVMVTGLVYMAASLDTENPSTLDKLMKHFEQCEPRFLPCFVQGLKYAVNPRIPECIHKRLQTISGNHALACVDILSYRNDVANDHLQSIVNTHTDYNVRIKTALAPAQMNETDMVMFLADHMNQCPPQMKEHVILSLLKAGHPLGVEWCREHSTVSPTPLIFMCLMLSGTGQDADGLIDRFHELEPPELKDGVVAALGYSGTEKSVEFLLTMDQEFEFQACRALKQISGKPEMSRDAFRDWWELQKSSFPESGRMRNGNPWTFEELVRIAGDGSSTADQRRYAVDEFIIRSGKYIPFEVDWPVARQREGIFALMTSIPETLRSSNPWTYGGLS
jgi:hypothetical protein